jgi:hypothetical protein
MPDGAALVTYSGLGQVDNVDVSDWLRRLLRGRTRTVDETLILRRQAATADLAGPAKRARVEHAFLVGAFLRRRAWAAVITNTPGPPGSAILDHFVTGAVPADEEPRRLVTGAGCNAIADADRALLERITRHRPRRPQDYCQVLAGVHCRAKHSRHPDRRTISQACTTIFLPPSGQGGKATLHWHEPDPPGETLPPKPLVHLGIDATEIVKVLGDHMLAMDAGQPLPDGEFSRRVDKAARRAVEPPTP